MFIKSIIIVVSMQLVCCARIERCMNRKKTEKRELSEQNVTISDELFQGDIVLTTEQEDMLRRPALRTGTVDVASRWPKNRNGLVIIPFTIRRDSGYTEREIEIIKDALQSIESAACIRFIPRFVEEDYIEFFSGGGCFSKLGRVGGRQTVSLRRSHCMEKGKVIHEVFHALGFTHMHNRVDRDDYIQVFPEKLMAKNYRQHFDKVDARFFDDFGTPYDLLSVMHYPNYAFARAHEFSILPCNSSYDQIIGNVAEMSLGDVERLNKMYECSVKP